MAKKPEVHIVIDGCIQEGKKVYVKGEEYTPPTPELAARLVAAGTIAPIRSATAQAVMRAAAPAPTPSPAAPGQDLLNKQEE